MKDDTPLINARLAWFEEMRQNREDKIINDLVSSVRSRKATFEQLWGGISTIAELRSLQIDLDNELRESAFNAEQEMNNA